MNSPAMIFEESLLLEVMRDEGNPHGIIAGHGLEPDDGEKQVLVGIRGIILRGNSPANIVVGVVMSGVDVE